jgi:acetyl-CoA C-acetyltransferase
VTTEAFVYDAIRTPRGRSTQTNDVPELEPAALTIRLIDEIRRRNPGLDLAQLDDLILGVTAPAGERGGGIAATAALAAGLPGTGTGVQLHRFSAPGLEAVNVAAQKVRSGGESLVLAGGVESMSRTKDPQPAVTNGSAPQGIGADLIATLAGWSRDDVDTYAATSQSRAAEAWAKSQFARSIVPVTDHNGTVLLAIDELVQPQTTVESLRTLQPAFAGIGMTGGFDAIALQRYDWLKSVQHVHTAGNSSDVVGGAALVLIGNEHAGRRSGLTPRARIVSVGLSDDDAAIMLTGPAPATRKALAKAGLTTGDIDLVEMNEAFAAVVLRFIEDTGFDPDQVNVNGGAIAMGDALGATGAILIGTLLDELEHRDLRYGLVTLPVGAGMGIATVLERL